MDKSPKVILLLSGKRKSGKDYIADKLHSKLGHETSSILRLSAPLKKQYAEEKHLNYSKLLDSSEYKEKYRYDMIRWGEEKRNIDPGYFCRIVSCSPESEVPVWIISDVRRKTDIDFFKTNYCCKVITMRVVADEAVRVRRGWVYTPGVDDVTSECDLDSGVTFDLVLANNGDDELEKQVNSLYQRIQKEMIRPFMLNY